MAFSCVRAIDCVADGLALATGLATTRHEVGAPAHGLRSSNSCFTVSGAALSSTDATSQSVLCG